MESVITENTYSDENINITLSEYRENDTAIYVADVVFPLIGGALVCWILRWREWSYPGRIARNLYHSGIATLTIGCIMQGVLEIYGTTNKLISIYWIVGIVFVFIGAGVYLCKENSSK